MLEQFKTLMREHFQEYPLAECGENEFTHPTVHSMWMMFQVCNAWEPIEREPKDEELFLGFVPHSCGGYQCAFYWNKDLMKYQNNIDGGTDKPTHWRPLPIPPLTTEGGA